MSAFSSKIILTLLLVQSINFKVPHFPALRFNPSFSRSCIFSRPIWSMTYKIRGTFGNFRRRANHRLLLYFSMPKANSVDDHLAVYIDIYYWIRSHRPSDIEYSFESRARVTSKQTARKYGINYSRPTLFIWWMWSSGVTVEYSRHSIVLQTSGDNPLEINPRRKTPKL